MRRSARILTTVPGMAIILSACGVQIPDMDESSEAVISEELTEEQEEAVISESLSLQPKDAYTSNTKPACSGFKI